MGDFVHGGVARSRGGAGVTPLFNGDGGEAVGFAGDVAGFGVGAGAAETVHVEGAALLYLEALETVSGVEAGVKGFFNNETVLSQICHGDETVGKPAELKA